MDDSISRQAAIDAVRGRFSMPVDNLIVEVIGNLPSAQPEYEPVTVEDFAKTMSEKTLYGFMTWHGEALNLIRETGFEICKKVM